MQTLRTSLIISAFLATSATAFAMPPGGAMAGGEMGCTNERQAGEYQGRMAKHQTERLKRLHEALKLQPEQESAWQKFQAALEPAKEGINRSAGTASDTPSRLEQMRERHQQAGKMLESHIDAVKTFYASLTPEQKKAFDDFHTPNRDRRSPR